MRETIFVQLSLDIVKSYCIVFQRHIIKKQTIFGHLKTTDWTKAKNVPLNDFTTLIWRT
jgi:hypothetical protein